MSTQVCVGTCAPASNLVMCTHKFAPHAHVHHRQHKPWTICHCCTDRGAPLHHGFEPSCVHILLRSIPYGVIAPIIFLPRPSCLSLTRAPAGGGHEAQDQKLRFCAACRRGWRRWQARTRRRRGWRPTAAGAVPSKQQCGGGPGGLLLSHTFCSVNLNVQKCVADLYMFMQI